MSDYLEREVILPTLGDQQLDAEHRVFLELVLQLQGCPQEDALAMLDQLSAHASHHFEQEDQDLLTMKGGNTQCHIDEHAAVLKSLEDVRQALMNGQIPVAKTATVLTMLSERLVGWLHEHVKEMDVAISADRLRRRTGGQAVQFQRRQVAHG